MKIKSRILSFLQEFNSENLGKTLDSFDKGMAIFNKGVQEFGKSMDSMTRELSSDVQKSHSKREFESKKNQKNVEKLFGSKSDVKIWSDKKFKL